MKKQKNFLSIKQNCNDNEQGPKVIKDNTMITSNIAKELYFLMIKESNKYLIAKNIMNLSKLNLKLNSKIKLDKIIISMIMKYKLYLIEKELTSETKD